MMCSGVHGIVITLLARKYKHGVEFSDLIIYSTKPCTTTNPALTHRSYDIICKRNSCISVMCNEIEVLCKEIKSRNVKYYLVWFASTWTFCSTLP